MTKLSKCDMIEYFAPKGEKWESLPYDSEKFHEDDV